jgi:ankyrin repeat protein
MESYEYESINLEDDLSFRLVHLLKGEDGPIQCTLFHANLREVEGLIDYEALSYTWGDPQGQHKIEIDGKEMSVRENLYLALRHLRYTNKDRILWIDAICIDQKNRKEQGHQVRQMGFIYKKAERVIIWLGAATPETDVVLEFLQRLERKSYKYQCSSWKASDGRWQELWWALGDEHRRYIAPESRSSEASVLLATPDQQDGFEDLLRRRWFRRVWIIQEVANARSARVVCGSKSVSARIFAIMPPLMRIRFESQCQSILDIMPGPSRNHSWWTRERDLKRLLLQFQGSEASDPRDHIYALLSIASDGYSNNILVPDYNKSLEDVIKDTVAFLLDFPENWRATYQLPDWTISELYRNLHTLDLPILISSIEKGFQATVEMLLCRENLDVNGHTSQGQSPLWTAVEYESAPTVKLLLDKGAEVDLKNKKNHNVVLRAWENNSKQVVELLLEKCDEINIESGKYGKMLFEALHKNEVDFVKMLLDMGADANAISKEYHRALQVASNEGHESIVESLLAKRASFTKENKFERTSLSLAVEHGHWKVVELLLGSEVINTDFSDSRVSLLSRAVRSGKWEIVKLLLTFDEIDVNLLDFGVAPLCDAAIRGYWKIVELLLAVDGIDVNSLDSSGSTPLIQAIQSRRRDMVELLLAIDGIDVNFPCTSGLTPLSQAVRKGSSKIVELLLAIDGIDTEIPDQSGMTPMSYAALSAKKIIFECLRSSNKAVFQPKSILTATNIRLEDEQVLKARLMDRKGVWQDAKIHLDVIVVDNGHGSTQFYLIEL